MKGLAVTILLAILEIGAITASSGGSLLTDGPNLPAARREEGGRRAKTLVDIERPEFLEGHHLAANKNEGSAA